MYLDVETDIITVLQTWLCDRIKKQHVYYKPITEEKLGWVMIKYCHSFQQGKDVLRIKFTAFIFKTLTNALLYNTMSSDFVRL